jgi:hypothetical protein
MEKRFSDLDGIIFGGGHVNVGVMRIHIAFHIGNLSTVDLMLFFLHLFLPFLASRNRQLLFFGAVYSGFLYIVVEVTGTWKIDVVMLPLIRRDVVYAHCKVI